ncbi:hypothetical protein E2C01_088588 [Portunus trituberculatus]|uniref:Uncharacterized protein n=1 Tax=Portunus trituberculatus TaxID=210409 RepID=A0A5B7J9P3_PORTR|nr:hypothetical protein [Portunus trituberculatus]
MTLTCWYVAASRISPIGIESLIDRLSSNRSLLNPLTYPSLPPTLSFTPSYSPPPSPSPSAPSDLTIQGRHNRKPLAGGGV